MTLSIYNTLTGKKEPFTPLTPGKVRIYVCGPTVYDMAHVGHARVYVAFDVIVRHLRRHYDVFHVRNYTDIDDKIIQRARELGEPPTAVSERYITEFNADMRALNVEPADVEPKVTDHLDDILGMIERLVDKGYAYRANGDVYFAVHQFGDYGKLSRRNLAEMEAGARVEVEEKKRDPMDFVLWKEAKPGEPAWPSPWGQGRPGWHIECSAMSNKYLGQTFDIHGGGKDLIFPHHENEIAQSEAASGKAYVRVWMHNGFVQVDDEKMSKSLGNFFTVRDLLERFSPQSLRYYLLTTHYRSPINFSDTNLNEAEQRVRYLYETLSRLQHAVGEPLHAAADSLPEGDLREPQIADVGERFAAAMDDDFNAPRAVAALSDCFRWINEILDRPSEPELDRRSLHAIRVQLKDAASVLGLFLEDPDAVLTGISQRRTAAAGVDEAQVEALIAERAQARKQRDFGRADDIRDRLAAMGVVLRDSPEGTTWEIKSA